MTLSEMRTRTITAAVCILILGAIAALPRVQADDADQADPGAERTEPVNARLVRQGKRLYVFCQACHSIEASSDNKIGPHLAGIINRPAANLEGATYSAELKEQDFVWSEEKLDLWIKQPSAMVPGTIMSFVGIEQAELRSALIAYLKTL